MIHSRPHAQRTQQDNETAVSLLPADYYLPDDAADLLPVTRFDDETCDDALGQFSLRALVE